MTERNSPSLTPSRKIRIDCGGSLPLPAATLALRRVYTAHTESAERWQDGMALSDTHEEQIVRVLDRLLLSRARARRSTGTRFDQPLDARSLGTDHVLIVHRSREHGDRGAVRLVREVRADDHRFLRGQPARQITGGARKRVGLEAEILARELGAASTGTGSVIAPCSVGAREAEEGGEAALT